MSKSQPYRQTGKLPCPNCGYKFDSFMGADSASSQPNLGDMGVCLECGDLYWFTASGPQSLSAEEYTVALQENEKLRKVLYARSQVMEKGYDGDI